MTVECLPSAAREGKRGGGAIMERWVAGALGGH